MAGKLDIIADQQGGSGAVQVEGRIGVAGPVDRFFPRAIKLYLTVMGDFFARCVKGNLGVEKVCSATLSVADDQATPRITTCVRQRAVPDAAARLGAGSNVGMVVAGQEDLWGDEGCGAQATRCVQGFTKGLQGLDGVALRRGALPQGEARGFCGFGHCGTFDLMA